MSILHQSDLTEEDMELVAATTSADIGTPIGEAQLEGLDPLARASLLASGPTVNGAVSLADFAALALDEIDAAFGGPK
ncbi:MAG: hypothetical protein H6619_05360 [Deltaproteobacteria bacterium]|nr:hypothetical protein [Deltaproteobacteria bacterium]